MTTAYGAGPRFENKGQMLFKSNNNSRCDELLAMNDDEASTVGTKCASCTESYCRPFVLPWTSKAERRRLTRLSKVIEFAAYVLVSALVIYSVAVNSLPVLMSAIIATGLYIVLYHLYKERVRTRQEISDNNFRSLVSPSLGRN